MLKIYIPPVTQKLIRDTRTINSAQKLFQKYLYQELTKTQIRTKFRFKATNEYYEKAKKKLEQYFSINKLLNVEAQHKDEKENCKICEKILEHIFGKSEEKSAKTLTTSLKQKEVELITKIETIEKSKQVETVIKSNDLNIPLKALSDKVPDIVLTKQILTNNKERSSDIIGNKTNSLLKEIGQFGVPVNGKTKSASNYKNETNFHKPDILKKPGEAITQTNKQIPHYRVHIFRQTIEHVDPSKKIETVNAVVTQLNNTCLLKDKNTDTAHFTANNTNNNLKLDHKVISDINTNTILLSEKMISKLKNTQEVFSSTSKENVLQPKSGGETIKIEEEGFVTLNTGKQSKHRDEKDPEKREVMAKTTSMCPVNDKKESHSLECTPNLPNEKVSLNELLKRVRYKNRLLCENNSGYIWAKDTPKCPSLPPIKCPSSPCAPPSNPRCPSPCGPKPPKCPPPCPGPQRQSPPCHTPPTPKPVCPPPKPACPSNPHCPPPRGPQPPICPPACPDPKRKSPTCHQSSAQNPICPPPKSKIPPTSGFRPPGCPSTSCCPPPRTPARPKCPTPCPGPRQTSPPCHQSSSHKPICPPPKPKSPSSSGCPPPRQFPPPCPGPQRKSPCNPPPSHKPICPPTKPKGPQPCAPPQPPCPSPCSPKPICPPLPKATPPPRHPSPCPPPNIPRSTPPCAPKRDPTCPPPPPCRPKCPDPCKKFTSFPSDFIILYTPTKLKLAFDSSPVELVEDQINIRSKSYKPWVPIPSWSVPKEELRRPSWSSFQPNPKRIPPPRLTDSDKDRNPCINPPFRKVISLTNLFWMSDS